MGSRQGFSTKWTKTAFFLVLVLLSSKPLAYADDGERIFKQAPAYTVQIRTFVELPFAEDHRTAMMGAGFVVDARRGWVMTNAHVAARSPSQIRVAFRGGNYEEAQKLYVDSYLDLAILQLGDEQRAGLLAAKLDCGEFPPVGHPVGAFGHPWGLSYTGTRGIISGVTSKMGTEMLQTDAPINGGNSGGPLISLQTGKVVGISTSRMDDEKDQNTNFAVPMKYACRVLELLEEGKDPSPPELSTVFLKDLDEHDRLTVGQTYLDAGTLALQAGDVIRSIAGVPGEIHNEAQLVHALRGRLNHVGLNIIRAGRDTTVTGRLRAAGRVTERQGIYVSGILFAPTGFRDRRELNVDQPLMVHYVEGGSLGESLEIAKWDILVTFDGEPVKGFADFYRHLQVSKQAGKPCVLVLKRWSSRRDRIYDYVERTVQIEDLKLVGPAIKARLASQ